MRWLVCLLLLGAAPIDYPSVRPGTPIIFPRDHGAHPDFRTEWWYVTGWLTTAEGQQRGFQLTFFRTRPAVNDANPSKFTPRQIMFAHAAIAAPKAGHLVHDQRISRAGFGLADARVGDMAVKVDDWTLVRRPDGIFRARVTASSFDLNIALTPTQPPLLQGRAGYSQKGPDPREASHYYSIPQLRVSGTLDAQPVTGTAWMDREWSSTLLNPRATGWDWLGLNMDDGGALTLFRVRDAAGAAVWAGGSYRDKDGEVTILKQTDVRFAVTRRWRSPRTGASYPVAPTVSFLLRGKKLELLVKPLFDDQELDSRRGGGPVYWEGAVTVPGGRGYLEMTGYQKPLNM